MPRSAQQHVRSVIKVRKFAPGDYDAVRALFVDGMHTLIPRIFLAMIRCDRQFHTILVAALAVSSAVNWGTGAFEIIKSLLLTASCFMALVYVLAALRHNQYIQHSMAHDMKDIQGFYMSNPKGTHNGLCCFANCF